MEARNSTPIFSVIFALALMLFIVPQANAQEPAAPPPPPEEVVQEPAVEAEASVSEEELTSFARAYAQIQQLSADAENAAAAASTPEEAQAAQADAQSAMEAAIAAQGLTAEQYTDIAAKVNADPALQARVAEIVERDG